MDIPQSLYEILLAIVNIYSSEKRPVTSVEIAEYVGKSDGTVRNVISALKAMGLVEAKTGPGGGYVPTVKGVEIARGNVAFDKLWEPIRLIVNGRPTQLYVLELDFMGLGGPLSPKVVLKVVGSMHQVTRGSRVVVGPTQATRVIVRGEVVEVNSSRREILVNVESMVALPRLKARELMTGNVLSVSPDESLRKVAEIILEKNIRALPVVDGSGRLVGIISAQHIAKAFLRSELTASVCEYMDRDVPTVTLEEDILDIMRLMDNRNVGRVVVVDEQGSPAGIITRTDILKTMTRMYDFSAPSRETP
jgi:predicted transcriptional regulator